MLQSSEGGHGISEKEGPEAIALLSFPNTHPELAISVVGKAHVTKTKLN